MAAGEEDGLELRLPWGPPAGPPPPPEGMAALRPLPPVDRRVASSVGDRQVALVSTPGVTTPDEITSGQPVPGAATGSADVVVDALADLKRRLEAVETELHGRVERLEAQIDTAVATLIKAIDGLAPAALVRDLCEQVAFMGELLDEEMIALRETLRHPGGLATSITDSVGPTVSR